MVDVKSIQTAFDGLVGWKQPIIPDYAIVDTANQASSSGQYFQGVSNLVTIQNIKVTQSFVDITDEQFNDKLRELSSNAILKLVNAVFYEDDLLENRLLYVNEYDWTNPIENNSDFVGFQIDVCKNKDLTSILNRVFASFDGVDNVKLLLFHSSKREPIANITIETKANDEVVSELDWRIPYTNGISGGTYYVGYLTSGLTAKAYDRNYELANNIACFNLSHFQPIKVSGWDSETLFDVNDVENVSESFGLNFDVSGFKDYTSVVLNNKRRFIYAYQLMVAAEVMDLLINSVRSDRTERISKGNVLLELNGNLNNPDLPRVVGINNKLKEELDELKKAIIPENKIIKQTLR